MHNTNREYAGVWRFDLVKVMVIDFDHGGCQQKHTLSQEEVQWLSFVRRRICGKFNCVIFDGDEGAPLAI